MTLLLALPFSPRPENVATTALGSPALLGGGGGSLTDDYSDYLMSPSGSDQDKVSFKTEVASPSHSAHEHLDGEDEDCACKEEVEKEEARALVQAIEQSSVEQYELPYVPGLSRDSEQTVTIHCDAEVSVNV